jgi:hypothetical protein
MAMRWGDRALGLLLSAGIHLVLLLGTALVFIEQLIAIDTDILICRFPAPRIIVPLDMPRDVCERKGPPSGDGQRFDPFDEATFSPGSTETWLPGSDIIPIDDGPLHGSSASSPLAVSLDRSRRNDETRFRFLVRQCDRRIRYG